MIRVLALLALSGADASGNRPTSTHSADVAVVLNGTARHGRLIVTGDGGIHLEHLDVDTRRWAEAVLRRAASPPRGWDDRLDPVRCVWGRLGPEAVLAEVHTPVASVFITRHGPLPTR